MGVNLNIINLNKLHGDDRVLIEELQQQKRTNSNHSIEDDKVNQIDYKVIIQTVKKKKKIR